MKCYFAIILSCLLLVSCGGKEKSTEGLFYDTDGVPAIECFSGTEYEDYTYQFLPVVDAALTVDGVKTKISEDDPRLIKLLNFLAYSLNQDDSWWRQGIVEEEEVNEMITSASSMLEIHFDTSVKGSGGMLETSQIVVFDENYLRYVNDLPNMECEETAEEFFPYRSLLEGVPSDRIPSPWIDVLTYAGFK